MKSSKLRCLYRLYGRKFGIISYFVLFYVIPSQAIADSLPDPTRPYNAQSVSVEQAVPILQSILISPFRQEVIISGKRMVVGDKFAGARLIRIDKDKAVLRGVQGQQILSLFPKTNKKEIKLEKKSDGKISISESSKEK